MRRGDQQLAGIVNGGRAAIDYQGNILASPKAIDQERYLLRKISRAVAGDDGMNVVVREQLLRMAGLIEQMIADATRAIELTKGKDAKEADAITARVNAASSVCAS